MVATSTFVLIAASASSMSCAAFVPPAQSLVGDSHLSNAHDNNGALIPSPLSRLQNNRICSSHTNASRRDTSLSMGVRSFIKRKILRRGEDKDEDGESVSSDVTLNSILQSQGSVGSMESPLSIDENGAEGADTGKTKAAKASKSDTAKKYVEEILSKDPEQEATKYYEEEDTQDRIRRMKRGGMTEEEKMNFLSTALSRPSPNQKPTGPPIRQTIPGMEDAISGSKDRNAGGEAKSASASGKTENSVWNAITGRKSGGKDDKGRGGGSASSSPPGEISVASLMMDGKMKNEEAKRRYLESVTNPDRFSTFSTQRSPASKAEEPEALEIEVADEENEVEVEGGQEDEIESADDVATADDTGFAEMKRQIEEDRELLNPNKKENEEQSAAREAVESILSMISSNNDKKASDADITNATATTGDKPKSTDHLAARLEQAAEEQEKRDAEARLAATEKREEEKRAWSYAQKQREEELRRKEVERMEKARLIAEEQRRKEEEKEAAERAELEARQSAQDEYWAKMLKKERSRIERSEPVELKRRKEVIARDSEESLERDVAKDVEREKIRDEERAREDPHEGEILKEVSAM